MSEKLLKLLAPLVALLAATAKTFVPSRLLGTEGWHWNPIRRLVLPPLDRLKRDRGLGYGSYSLSEDEFAGSHPSTPREVGEELAKSGYSRMPLSALKKSPDGSRVESASWAKRESTTADYQTHVMLFENDDGGTDVYAHHEYNAMSPKHAYEHYRGVDQNFEKGIEMVKEDLTEIK